MSIIPKHFMDAVVALGVEVSPTEKRWIATGFIVGRREIDNPTVSTCYIITNKHVVNGHSSLLVRFNSQGKAGIKDLKMDLKIDGKEMFSRHERNEVDVVAIQIIPSVVIRGNAKLSFIDLTEQAITLNQMESTGVQEGSLVYSLGFPMNLVHEVQKAPICRLGCISRVSDGFIYPELTPSFLVDAEVFPGNSGGPVINRPEMISISGTPNNSKSNLIGVLSAYIPYEEKLINTQTERVQMVRSENSGLTVVHPVDRIKEVVELEWMRVQDLRSNLGAKDQEAPVGVG